MPVYVPTVYTAGGTADYPQLNHAENGIASCVQQDGSTPMTGSLILATGHQETGPVGAEGIGTGGANAAGSLAGYLKGFRMEMTNIPSSITLTSTTNTNIDPSYPTVDTITKDGFNFNVRANAAGLYFWHGTYTTVGNCLLDVTRRKRQFDHHCSSCGALHRGVGVRDLVVKQHPPEWRRFAALAYFCPDCGDSEHFHTGYHATDERNRAPQGRGEYLTTLGAQARLIRALMRLVGLPVAP